MKSLFFIYIMLFGSFSYAEEFKFYDNSKKHNYEFYIKCDRNFKKCKLHTVLNKKSSEYHDFLEKEMIVNYIGNNITELVASCGYFCLKSIYFDINNKKISKIFYMPVKIDVTSKLVISSGEEDNKLKLSEIFGSKEVNIERDYSFVNPVSNTINPEETKFLADKKLQLSYQTGDDYKYKTEIIDLKELGF